MNDTESLTALLHVRADRKLEKEIDKKLPERGEFGRTVEIPRVSAENLKDSIKPSANAEEWTVYVPYLIDALRAAGNRHLRDDARQREVREFLAKVEAAAVAIDELQSEGGGQ